MIGRRPESGCNSKVMPEIQAVVDERMERDNEATESSLIIIVPC